MKQMSEIETKPADWYVARFTDGPLDGHEWSLPGPIDKVCVTHENGTVWRYECDVIDRFVEETTEVVDICRMLPTSNREAFDEELRQTLEPPMQEI